MYVVHHSHTDIGYTDLQERVIDTQTSYIRRVLEIMRRPENAGFRWNCETMFCVEEFLRGAAKEETEAFMALAGAGRIGLSWNYLNFTDLVDSGVLQERLCRLRALFAEHGVAFQTAMTADINGISMGQRDAMLAAGAEFLYTNIHCHHGMYPLYQNQTPFFWESAAGRRMLVWNGEHYNLGNVLGIKPNVSHNFMMQNYLGRKAAPDAPEEILHASLDAYLSECTENGYPYDFLIASVSGVFSDNAPPEPEILRTVEAYNRKYGGAARLQMVSLQELYSLIRDRLADAPVYRGDLTDWWANGVGSTPYAVKHYREAQHRYHLCGRLDPDFETRYPRLAEAAQDNILLYSEHTWGHSSTITRPYDTMVLNLDMRKNSYASKAHEAASRMLYRIAHQKGDILSYYDTNGKIRVYSVNALEERQYVSFYIETMGMPDAEITDEQGRVIPCQVSPHPRGRMISFTDTLRPFACKTYFYREMPAPNRRFNSRKAYVGAERVRDIVNDYDPVTYRLPYEFENDFFLLRYAPGDGITAFVDKRTGKSLLAEGAAPFFTPIYERTAISDTCHELPCREEQERRILGRNIRGRQAELFVGRLREIECVERGNVFTLLRFVFSMPGSIHTEVYLRLFDRIPRIDFRLELGKTLSTDIESVFLPLSLPCDALWLRKGTEAYRPGIDQLPGTCMEYSMSDDGLAFVSQDGGALIATRDVPLVYMGPMRHHPIRLCDREPTNNKRPVYSWVMNNTWETNFKMDLSGFGEYNYSLWLTQTADGEPAMDELRERAFDPYVLMIGNQTKP